MRLCFALFVFLVASRASAQGTGALAGRVIDIDLREGIIGAIVRIDGTTLSVQTDFDGAYRIAEVPVGTYNVTVSWWGDEPHTRANVVVTPGQVGTANFVVTGISFPYEPLTLEQPMFTTDYYTVRTLYGEDIERMPVNR
jgi:hypothetical protein